MFGVGERGAAGRSTSRKYKQLSRSWRHRTFGRRTALYAWSIYAVVAVVVISLHLSSRWALYAGLTLGMVASAMWMLPDALMPGFIFQWQLGAWGEEMTASELKKVKRNGWVVRHDVKWRGKANHDHVVAGPAVFVLNSKNLKDSSVSLENGALRVARIEDPEDGYLADRWVPRVAGEARSLRYELARATGFPVHVYPVIVVWGRFAAEEEWVGDVCVVRGDKVANWIANRPADLLDPAKRARVGEYVRALPNA